MPSKRLLWYEQKYVQPRRSRKGVLTARIDRLSAEEKALLQQLSVIGRQFPVSVVKQVVSQPEAELYDGTARCHPPISTLFVDYGGRYL